MTPRRSRNVFANGLEHHVLEWLPPRDSHQGSPPTAALLHGYADAAGTWDPIAEGLAARGLRVIAPDLRGFGQAPRAPTGTYYHFPDYVADVAGIIDALSPEAPVLLAGHSMGGTVSVYLAGARPDRIARLALLEGLGPPDNTPESAPDRLRKYLEDSPGLGARRVAQRPVGTRVEALRRLAVNHTGVDLEVLRARLEYLVEDVGDGQVVWRFDPLHRCVSPSPFYARHLMAFCKRITCPVLAIGGGATGFHPPDEDLRLAALANATHVELPDAGHMMHWTRPAEVTRLVGDFFLATGET